MRTVFSCLLLLLSMPSFAQNYGVEELDSCFKNEILINRTFLKRFDIGNTVDDNRFIRKKTKIIAVKREVSKFGVVFVCMKDSVEYFCIRKYIVTKKSTIFWVRAMNIPKCWIYKIVYSNNGRSIYFYDPYNKPIRYYER